MLATRFVIVFVFLQWHYIMTTCVCVGRENNMAWAANFDDFLHLPVTNNASWNMQTSGMHNAFGNADPANVITETMSIAELYSGMPLVVCLFTFICLFHL